MADSTFGLAAIGQVHVPVGDLARAVRFYRDALGMRFVFEAPSMAFFDCGGIRLMLGVPERPEHAPPGSILYFDVADIEEAHRTLAERGVEFVDRPHKVADLGDRELWMAFFRDGEENVLALMSEVPR